MYRQNYVLLLPFSAVVTENPLIPGEINVYAIKIKSFTKMS